MGRSISGDEAPAGPAAEPPVWLHATALVVAETGLLIRGASGAGKSRLALGLIAAARRRSLFARLVGDDRVAIAQRAGRLLARPHPAISGQIESRGDCILDIGFEPAIVVRLVLDLGPSDGAVLERLPSADAKVGLGASELPAIALDSADAQHADMVFERVWRMRNG